MTRTMSADNREFYSKLWRLALPICLQNLISVAVSMTDTLMLGRLGEVQLSSASVANQFFFMLMIMGFGLNGGANVLIAQYWGKKDVDTIHRVMALVYRIAFIMSMVFAAVAFFVPAFVARIFTNDLQVVEGAASYLRTIALFYPLFSLGNATSNMLRSVGEVTVPTVTYAISVFINIFFNWVFIFGNLGAPRMEVVGAALATGIARFSEFVILTIYLLFVEKRIRFRLKYLFATIGSEIGKKFLTNSAPIFLNEILWSLGHEVTAVIIGHMGKEFIAANSINDVVMQIANIAIMGLGSAAAVIIGNTVGEGRYELAQSRAKKLTLMALIMGVVCGLLVFLIRVPVVSLYSVSDLTKSYALAILIVTAFLVFCQSLTMMTMIGILRGGGDGRFVLFLDVSVTWLVAIPLGALAGLVFHWSIPVTYALLKIDELVKMFLSIPRILGGKWIKDVTL